MKYKENVLPGGAHSLVENSDDVLLEIFQSMLLSQNLKEPDKVWEIGVGYPAFMFILSLLTNNEVLGTDVGETFNQIALTAKTFMNTKIVCSKSIQEKITNQPKPQQITNPQKSQTIKRKTISASSDEDEDNKSDKKVRATPVTDLINENETKDNLNSTGEKAIICLYNIPLSESDMKRLGPGKWLNDSLIDVSLQVSLTNFSRELQKKVMIYSTYFYSKLIGLKDNNNKGSKEFCIDNIKYENVNTWNKNISFFELKLACFPINILNGHWNLCVILRPDKFSLLIDNPKLTRHQNEFRIIIMDSALSIITRKTQSDAFYMENILQNMLKYTLQVSNTNIKYNYQLLIYNLLKEYKNKIKPSMTEDELLTSEKSFINKHMLCCYSKLSQQQNGFDCGVYVIRYFETVLEYLTKVGADGTKEDPKKFLDRNDLLKADEVTYKRRELLKNFNNLAENKL